MILLLIFSMMVLRLTIFKMTKTGLQSLESPRFPISVHFFLMGIMFLIYVDIVLIMHLIIVMNTIKTKTLL